jgi:nucleoside-diphosphate-sugar epimerase
MTKSFIISRSKDKFIIKKNYFRSMILVTGGTGLVGAHLLYQLSLDTTSVVAIHRESSDLNAVKNIFSYYTDDYENLFNKIIWKIADINNIPSLNAAYIGITHVYHCAAVISFDKKDEPLLRKVNIDGTANMVNIALDHAIEKFCFVSSIATISKAFDNSEITEENEWNPTEKNSGYAISKYGAETEVWRGSQEGLDVIIVNPGMILGAGYWNTNTGKLFDLVQNGFKFYTEGVTGYVGVVDVVKSMLLLMKSSIKNERFIIVAENRSFKEVLCAIADGFSKKRPSIKVTSFLSEVAWRLAFLKSLFSNNGPIISKESSRASTRRSYYSNKKIKSILNYKFEPLLNCIKKVCNNYKQDH